MKKFIALACVLTLTVVFVLESAAQDKKELLWLVGEEQVKPEMIDQYYEVSKELMELCKAEKFPYAYNVWNPQPFNFALWYPIEEMNDITRIDEAWDAIIEKFGEEKFTRFNECIESQINKVMVTQLNLSYEPDSPRLSEEEIGYSYMQEIYVKKGSEKAVEDLFTKAIAIMKEKGLENATYIGKGMMGYKQPVYFAWSYGKDRIDFLEQQKKEGEILAEEFKQLNSELIKHIKDINNTDDWWVRELSYKPEE
jgi:hypothetical protein